MSRRPEGASFSTVAATLKKELRRLAGATRETEA
jgi:hypothetical protein